MGSGSANINFNVYEREGKVLPLLNKMLDRYQSFDFEAFDRAGKVIQRISGQLTVTDLDVQFDWSHIDQMAYIACQARAIRVKIGDFPEIIDD